jgi:hypothetical protein
MLWLSALTACASTLMNNLNKEATMKLTLLAALLAVVGLTACEKTESTTVVPPATTVIETPAATPAAVPVPVPVPGPAGPAGAPGPEGAPGTPGEPGKDGDTVLIVPEPAK